MQKLLTVEFPQPLPLWPLDDDQAEVTATFDVWLELWSGRRVLLATIPQGFVFDGVSRPGLLAWWVKRWGPEVEEALLHDWLLYLLRAGEIARPKFLIDLFFLLTLVCGGRSFLRSSLMFLAVRTRRA